jgi:hypothetical protein
MPLTTALPSLLTVAFVAVLAGLAIRGRMTARRLIQRLVDLHDYKVVGPNELRMPDGARLLIHAQLTGVAYRVFWLGSDTEVMSAGSADDTHTTVKMFDRLMGQNMSIKARRNADLASQARLRAALAGGSKYARL